MTDKPASPALAPAPGADYALAATFATADAVRRAAEAVRDAGYSRWDVISPFPIHGIEAAMGMGRPRIGAWTFAGGAAGLALGYALAWFTGAVAYPLVVGARPFASPLAPFPVAFELAILLASFGTIAGVLVANRLPRYHHPVLDHPDWVRFSDDRFCIVIECADPRFDARATRALLEKLGGQAITAIPS